MTYWLTQILSGLAGWIKNLNWLHMAWMLYFSDAWDYCCFFFFKQWHLFSWAARWKRRHVTSVTSQTAKSSPRNNISCQWENHAEGILEVVSCSYPVSIKWYSWAVQQSGNRGTACFHLAPFLYVKKKKKKERSSCGSQSRHICARIGSSRQSSCDLLFLAARLRRWGEEGEEEGGTRGEDVRRTMLALRPRSENNLRMHTAALWTR